MKFRHVRGLVEDTEQSRADFTSKSIEYFKKKISGVKGKSSEAVQKTFKQLEGIISESCPSDLKEDRDYFSLKALEAFNDAIRSLVPDYSVTKQVHQLKREIKNALDGSLEVWKQQISSYQNSVISLAPLVEPIAKKFKDNNFGLETQELIGIGNEALAYFLKTKKMILKSNEAEVTNVIEKAMKEHIASEVRYRLETVSIEDTPESKLVSGINAEESLITQEKREIVFNQAEQLKGSYKEVIQSRFGIERDLETTHQMGKKYNCTASNISAIEKKALKTLRKPPYINSLLEIYVPCKRGSHSRTVKTDEKSESLEYLMGELEKNIMRATGGSMSEFRTLYNFSKHDFADLLADIYPELSTRSALRLITLSENEKAYSPCEPPQKNITNIDDVRNTLKQLENKNEHLNQDKALELRNIVRNLYFPMFLADKTRCFSVLEDGINGQENPESLRKILSETHAHFSGVDALKVNGLLTPLDDYQRVDVSILNENDRFIIANEMGTGKSLEAIAYGLLKDVKKAVIISTRSAVYSTWPSELVKHLDGTLSISILDGDKLSKGLVPDAKWNLVTYNTARRFIDQIQALNPDLIVLDECHKINNEDSLQSQEIKKLDSKFKLAVSGSLFKNRRSELYPILNWLFPESFNSKNKFTKEYCLNSSGLFRLQYELRNRMVHRFKDQVLNLPPVDSVKQEVFFSPEARKEYDQIEQDFVDWYKSKFQDAPAFGSVVLSKMHSLRLKAIEPKYPVLDEILSKILKGNNEKVVIYSSYRDVVHGIADKYDKEYGTCYLTGQSSGPERAAQINRFNECDWKKIFVVSAAGGESVDLTAAANIIYMNKPLTFADEKQLLDRLHRRRQTRPVVSYNLVTSESIDARIENLIGKKREEYKRTVHDAFGYEPEIRDSLEQNLKQLITELISSRQEYKTENVKP